MHLKHFLIHCFQFRNLVIQLLCYLRHVYAGHWYLLFPACIAAGALFVFGHDTLTEDGTPVMMLPVQPAVLLPSINRITFTVKRS